MICGLPARVSFSVSHFFDTTFRPCHVCENLDFDGPRNVPIKLTALRPNCRGCSILLQAFQLQAPVGLSPSRASHDFWIWRAEKRGPLSLRDSIARFPEFQIFTDPYAPYFTSLG